MRSQYWRDRSKAVTRSLRRVSSFAEATGALYSHKALRPAFKLGKYGSHVSKCQEAYVRGINGRVNSKWSRDVIRFSVTIVVVR